MLLRMKVGLTGPHYDLTRGQELAFGEKFPFTEGEVERLVAADFAELIEAAAPASAKIGVASLAPAAKPARRRN